MSSIFNENNMIQSLEPYLPRGETLTAGIHGVGIETHENLVLKCIVDDYRLIPAPHGPVLEINKSKFAKHDIYIGITQNYLLLTECEKNRHLYEFNEVTVPEGTDVPEPESTITLDDIGTCFPLADIQNCTIKKGWMGSVNCAITMKNGTTLKLMFPKLGGVGGGMPHHAEYREAIIAKLGTYSA